MRFIARVLRLAFAIGVGYWFLGRLSYYSQPFSGCDRQGFTTFVAGCNAWPNFGLGLDFVFLVAAIGPRALRPELWGLGLLTAMAMVGGPNAMMAGSHFEVWSDPVTIIAYTIGSGREMIIGGCAGLALYAVMQIALDRLRKSRQGNRMS